MCDYLVIEAEANMKQKRRSKIGVSLKCGFEVIENATI